MMMLMDVVCRVILLILLRLDFRNKVFEFKFI